jgi:DNA-binding NarL/FixJ family response regulator
MKPSAPAPIAPGPARIGLALVDDDPHFLLFLESTFAASARHRVVAVAGSAEMAGAWDARHAPHVALVDIALPGRTGAALVAELLHAFPQLLVIMLTARSDEEVLLESIRAGAVGYLLKGVDSAEIFAAIDDALAGGAPMSPAIARRVLALMRQQPATPTTTAAASAAELALLTPREREVLELVASGVSNKQVADRLGLALSTVKNALLAIYGKWRVRSRLEATLKWRGGR